MKENLKKVIDWLASCLEEDNGKLSMKRVLCLPAFMIVGYIIVHCLRNGIDISTYDKPIELLLGFISVLLGLTYIPTRNDKP